MKLKWDANGERIFETGVDHGVLYLNENGAYPKGVVWNGLSSITENPSGAEDNAVYADNIKYLNIKSAEEMGATIECYMYPDEWGECDGSAEVVPGASIRQQARKNFGITYRTRIGNDSVGDSYGYKIHLLWGCSTSPSEVNYQSVNDSPEANAFSFEITTTPVSVTGYRPTSYMTLDSTKIDRDKLAAIETILYGKDPTTEGGTDGVDARLPLPDEIISLLAAG